MPEEPPTMRDFLEIVYFLVMFPIYLFETWRYSRKGKKG